MGVVACWGQRGQDKSTPKPKPIKLIARCGRDFLLTHGCRQELLLRQRTQGSQCLRHTLKGLQIWQVCSIVMYRVRSELRQLGPPKLLSCVRTLARCSRSRSSAASGIVASQPAATGSQNRGAFGKQLSGLAPSPCGTPAESTFLL